MTSKFKIVKQICEVRLCSRPCWSMICSWTMNGKHTHVHCTWEHQRTATPYTYERPSGLDVRQLHASRFESRLGQLNFFSSRLPRVLHLCPAFEIVTHANSQVSSQRKVGNRKTRHMFKVSACIQLPPFPCHLIQVFVCDCVHTIQYAIPISSYFTIESIHMVIYIY